MNEDFFTNLEKKLENPPELSIIYALCIWTDLLGFGSQFYKTGWNISKGDWGKIQKRLLKAHTIALWQTSINERLMILNDGIARVTGLTDNPYVSCLLQISMFLRAGILTHMKIKKEEEDNNYPGARTVIAAGTAARYMVEEINVDDFYANYTKPDPKGLSTSAQKYGNPPVVYNPAALQMNTAFSKAYIIESAGKKAGIEGAEIYIDDSMVNIIKELAEEEEKGFIWEVSDNNIEFLVPRASAKDGDANRENVVIGFRLSQPIIPQGLPWSTKVYRILRFYPWDELTNEFYFDLE